MKHCIRSPWTGGFRTLALSMSLFLCAAAHAQLVADGATNTLSNVTNSINGNVIVGTNGSFTLLVLSDNALVTNSAHFVIGANTTARSNEVQLISPTARWLMGGSTGFRFLIVGSNGASSRLVVSNGALMSNNSDGVVGFGAATSNNVALVTGSGSTWSAGGQVSVGQSGVGNQLIVSDGGQVLSGDGRIGSAGANNQVLVTGAGSHWTNQTDFYVGVGGAGNRLLIENGGQLSDGTGIIGGNASSRTNEVVVTGAGSVWSNRLDLQVGQNGAFNRLIVSNGATVAAGNFIVGANAISTNNLVTVDGGTMRATNAAGTGLLDLRRGTAVLNAGSMELDQLLMTNTAGSFSFQGGTLSSRSCTVSNGSLFLVSGIANPATFVLAGNGTHSFLNGLIVSQASLTGNGTIVGTVGINIDGTLAPGTSVGRIVLSNSPSLNGTVVMEISKNGTALTNDVIQVAGTLTYGGSLIVSKTGPTALSAGNRFRLFDATDYGSLFSSLTLPPLNSGLEWTNKLGVDGSLEVVAVFPPTVQTLPANPVVGSTATLNGVANPKGKSTSAWFEWGTTTNYGNVTLPQSLGSGTNNTNFAQLLTNLTAGTYHFRAVGSNSVGTAFGTNQTFSIIGPAVQTLHAIPFGGTTATLYGVANPRGANTSAWFEWGGTTNYGNITPLQALGGGTNDTNCNEMLTNLMAGATYHFRAVASNSIAMTAGADQNFCTPDGELTQDAYVKASNASRSDSFGESVAASDNTVVIGAPGEDSNATGVNGDQSNNLGTNSGAAYVLVRNGNSWAQQAYLKASNTGIGDEFGSRIAISGDTLVVGTGFEDSNATGVNGDGSDNTATNSGAAYVFVRNGTNWIQQAYLKASNTEAQDEFGSAVAVSGDTIVVGAFSEASGATGINGNQADNSVRGAGAAYVFVRSGTNWSQQAYLKASIAGVINSFGISVAVSGDTIVVGANRFADSSFVGAAYVFVRSGTIWTQQALLRASNPGTNDGFGGSAVAISGDTIVVGAVSEDSNATGVNGDQYNNSATQSGAAYVFVRNGTNWTQQAYLKANNTGANDLFGGSVDISGDTVVAGAMDEYSNATGINGDGHDDSATNSGAAYVFVRSGTNWCQRAYLKASNTEMGDEFSKVAISGDIIVAGARGEDSNATGINGDQNNNLASFSGAAYVFRMVPSAAPTLSIAPSGASQVTLSWTPPTPGFGLQESLSLAPVAWSNSPSGQTNPVTIPVATPTKFFRLFKP
jgi:T5SS/PEP-CTERM-associated repeat protein